jgi:uncharacterized protein YbjT (DUF2867 family)
MLLLTGATGAIGSRLLPRLLEAGYEVRCLVREPKKLGAHRVDVQITMGDLAELADPYRLRQAMRGVDTVIHLAATIRDQPPRRIEELNGLASIRLLRAAEASGVERFHFFSALGASPVQRTRFFRAKALAEQAVLDSPLSTTVFAPSIVYDHSDPWVTLLRRFSFLPVMPVSGSGEARFQPVWADDVARSVVAALKQEEGGSSTRYELAGPEILTYNDMSDLVSRLAGRPRPLVHVPLPIVRLGLITLRRLFGEAVFATWEEAELMEVGMVSERGSADMRALGIEPGTMGEVLSGCSLASPHPAPHGKTVSPVSAGAPRQRPLRGSALIASALPGSITDRSRPSGSASSSPWR